MNLYTLLIFILKGVESFNTLIYIITLLIYFKGKSLFHVL
ncbi:hypothetical protein TPMD03_1 [Thiohalocapsa phage LS06-2018-MD03]|nr:hypothetical protein TPMD03_1 [Thiohalocapsa phage LS06-2018-MD03]